MRNKYSAKKVIIDNIKFDSKAEARKYNELKLLLRAGKIKTLELQPKFKILDSNTYRCNFTKTNKTKISDLYYTPDFAYITRVGAYVVVEVKGVKTEAYQIRKKMFLNLMKEFEVSEFHEIVKNKVQIFKGKI
jgi:ribosomal protein S3AE